MTADHTTDLRFPIGPFQPSGVPTSRDRSALVDEIAALPGEFRAVTQDLSDAQLDTPYRPGGWTVRQVVHHVPDSHLNAYVRIKLALTETTPTIRPYDEAAWAALPDSLGRVAPSLALLEALHVRWAALWSTLPDSSWSRTYHHPESGERVRLDTALALYAWHGRHHLAHVTALREREGW